MLMQTAIPFGSLAVFPRLDKDLPHFGRVHPIGSGRASLSGRERSVLPEATVSLRVCGLSSLMEEGH